VTYETIKVDLSPRGIATVALNRPERGNALNPVLLDELGTVFTGFAADEAVRVIILRGEGKHFCAGADVGGAGAGGAAPAFTLARMLEAVERCPKPTIALVQGAAAGGGMALATCCDVVLAGSEGFFSIPEVRLGMAPSPTLAALFTRAVGLRAFRRYGFSGERIVAAEALRLGVVSEVCAADALVQRALAIADAMLLGAPGAIATLKARVCEFNPPPTSAIFDPATRDAKHARTAEAEEGVAAFKEKRKPTWYPG
jgi:methylglutaconyl-CoA hydratase